MIARPKMSQIERETISRFLKIVTLFPPRRDRYGIRRALVATDSPSVVAELAALLAPQGVDVEALTFARSNVGGEENATLGSDDPARMFIERRDDVDVALAVASFLADAALLETADAFVGTHGSAVGNVFLLAMTARLGRLPAFEFLNFSPTGQMFHVLKPHAARLRRRYSVYHAPGTDGVAVARAGNG